MDKEIEGLNLADYKSIEMEALQQLNAGYKIIIISRLMLENSRKAIKALGGKTSIQDDEEAKEKREQQKSQTV